LHAFGILNQPQVPGTHITNIKGNKLLQRSYQEVTVSGHMPQTLLSVEISCVFP